MGGGSGLCFTLNNLITLPTNDKLRSKQLIAPARKESKGSCICTKHLAHGDLRGWIENSIKHFFWLLQVRIGGKNTGDSH